MQKKNTITKGACFSKVQSQIKFQVITSTGAPTSHILWATTTTTTTKIPEDGKLRSRNVVNNFSILILKLIKIPHLLV
jgi:hypothetical protein